MRDKECSGSPSIQIEETIRLQDGDDLSSHTVKGVELWYLIPTHNRDDSQCRWAIQFTKTENLQAIFLLESKIDGYRFKDEMGLMLIIWNVIQQLL